MKRIIIIFILFFASITTTSAQNGLIYQSYENGYNQATKPQSQVVRTTAYYIDYYGNYIKVPIRVEITGSDSYYGRTYAYVIAEWRSTGYSGQWQKLSGRVSVQNTIPMAAYGDTSELEKSFMHKALVNGRWYFFDL